MKPSIPRIPILGVEVSAINMPMALETIRGWIQTRQSHYVCVTPAHSVMECVDHPDLKAIYNASGLTTPDGMAIVWLLKARGQKQVDRVYGPDLLQALCADGLQTGYRHYFYGGAPQVVEHLCTFLEQKYPGLCVAGWDSPPFRELSAEEESAAVAKIRSAAPDIVWVGLGSPRQERWMAAHVDRLGVPALIGVGAAFDFLSGSKVQAPRWIQRSGLEWLFRLFSEPKKLWRRYVLGYPRFVVLVFLDWLSGKK